MRLSPYLRLFCCALIGTIGLTAAPAGAAPGRDGWGRPLPSVAQVANDSLHAALQHGRISESQYALARATSLFHLRRVRREYGQVARPDPHAATMLLRDLALRLRSLDGSEARQARALLARPDDTSDPTFNQFGLDTYSDGKVTECSTTRDYCLHWADPADSEHAPGPTDADANGKPDFVDDAIATMDEVWDSMADLGFRPPKPDGNSKNKGPNSKTDIYLANIGDAGVYGYCSTDDPNSARAGSAQYPYFDFSAYCVLDNDYSGQEFPDGTPLSNLQVTAAHEFFHAIQFAYDGAEDGWLMEGTATSMEDVVYDDINDNHQFLMQSQLVDPTIPLDYAHPNFNHPQFGLRYGAWLFWRFMSEELAGGPPNRDDSVIRQVWERVDASPVAQFNDEWSLKGAKNVAKQRGFKFKNLFADFGIGLLMPSLRFEEGAAYSSFLKSKNKLGHAPVTKSFVLDEDDAGSGWFWNRIDHLAGRYHRFLPGPNVGPNDLLKVKVDGPARWRGASATLLTVNGSGVTVRRMSLDKKGVGTMKVLFPEEAYLIVQNASTRVSGCYQFQQVTSCAGLPKDDGLKFRAKGKLIEG